MTRASRMTYLPLDIEFFDNDKVLDAGERAGWLYIAMCCRAKRLLSDGVLTRNQIERLHIPGWQVRLDALVEVGLVAVTDTNKYLVIGWLERNYSAAKVASIRAADRKRKGATTEGSGNPSGVVPASSGIPTGNGTDSVGALREVEVEGKEEVEVEVKRPLGSSRALTDSEADALWADTA